METWGTHTVRECAVPELPATASGEGLLQFSWWFDLLD